MVDEVVREFGVDEIPNEEEAEIDLVVENVEVDDGGGKNEDVRDEVDEVTIEVVLDVDLDDHAGVDVDVVDGCLKI